MKDQDRTLPLASASTALNSLRKSATSDGVNAVAMLLLPPPDYFPPGARVAQLSLGVLCAPLPLCTIPRSFLTVCHRSRIEANPSTPKFTVGIVDAYDLTFPTVPRHAAARSTTRGRS